MKLTYDDMWDFCEMLKPIIGDYHFEEARYSHDYDSLCVILESNDVDWGFKFICISQEKIKEILDHAAKF